MNFRQSWHYTLAILVSAVLALVSKLKHYEISYEEMIKMYMQNRRYATLCTSCETPCVLKM